MAELVIQSNSGSRPPQSHGRASIPVGGKSCDGDLDDPNLSDDSGYSFPATFVPGRPPLPPPRFIAPVGDPSSSDFSTDKDNHSAKSINYHRRPKCGEIRRSCLPHEESVNARNIVHECYIKKVPMKAPNHFKGDALEDFEMWWFQVDEYLNYHSEWFTDKWDKITWIASMLSDKALAWYHNRGIDHRHH
jgi:hypothetical protein